MNTNKKPDEEKASISHSFFQSSQQKRCDFFNKGFKKRNSKDSLRLFTFPVRFLLDGKSADH